MHVLIPLVCAIIGGVCSKIALGESSQGDYKSIGNAIDAMIIIACSFGGFTVGTVLTWFL